MGYVLASRVLASSEPPRSCDRDTNTQAEKLVPFKFYWAPVSLGLFVVPRLQPGGGSGGCSTLLLPTAPALSSGPREGESVDGRKRLETDHQSPHPQGVGPSLSPQLAQGPPAQLPQKSKALGAAPHSQSLASYVVDLCPLASHTAARLRGPSVGAVPFFSCGRSWAASPSLESDSSASLRMSFSIWGTGWA